MFAHVVWSKIKSIGEGKMSGLSVFLADKDPPLFGGRSPRVFRGRRSPYRQAPLAQHPRRERYVPANGPPVIHDLCKVLFQEGENLSPAVLIYDDPVVTAIEYNMLIRIVESLSFQTANNLLTHESGWPKTISLTRN